MIQALQYWRKKCLDRSRDNLEKYTSFVHILWEYFGQPLNFSADPRIYIESNKSLNK